MDHVKVLYWNAQGMQSKIISFYSYLVEHRIDVACISETLLKPTVRLHSHPDYKMFRLDRSGRGGGVAIVIHRRLTFEIAPHLNLKLIESIGAKIELMDSSTITIISCYLPGSTTNDQLRRFYKEDIRKICSSQSNFFACGDFNSKHRHWNCSRANTAGKILYDEYIERDFVIAHPPNETYYPDDPNRLPSTLDIVITDGRRSMTEPKCEDLSSDHRAVSFRINLNERAEYSNPRLAPCYKKANWDLYRFRVVQSLGTREIDLNDINTTDQVDRMVDRLTAIVKEAENVAVPLCRPDPYFIEITPEIRELLRMSRAARRRWQRTRDSFHLREARFFSKRASALINGLRNQNWSHKLENLEERGDRKNLWQVTRFCKNKAREIPPLKAGGSTYISAMEKAELFADVFEKFHANPLCNSYSTFQSSVERTVTRIQQSTPEVSHEEYPTPEELLFYVKKLKTSKSPGNDGIRNILIKNLPSRGLKYLNSIICACMKLYYFPKVWRHGNVAAIRKPGKDPTDPRYYRPISLLCGFSKLLERVVLSRIEQVLDANEVLPEQQYGFRSGRSTTHQLKRMTAMVSEGLHHRQSSGMLMFDIQKAFDQVWHEGLLYKMCRIGIPRYLTKMISSFLSDRTFEVVVNGKASSRKNIPFGVPQGAVLSPKLYCIFTYDVPEPAECEVGIFADDTAILRTHRLFRPINRGLEAAATQFCRFFDTWKINVNPEKTQLVFFTRRRTKQLPHQPFKFLGHDVQWDNQGKYLGMILDRQLTMKAHVDSVIGKTQAAIKLLYPMVSRRSKLSPNNKLHLYKVALRPIFSYACPVFVEMAETHYKRLQVLQNKTLKMMLNLPWRYATTTLHEDAEMETVHQFFQRLSTNFQSSLT